MWLHWGMLVELQRTALKIACLDLPSSAHSLSCSPKLSRGSRASRCQLCWQCHIAWFRFNGRLDHATLPWFNTKLGVLTASFIVKSSTYKSQGRLTLLKVKLHVIHDNPRNYHKPLHSTLNSWVTRDMQTYGMTKYCQQLLTLRTLPAEIDVEWTVPGQTQKGLQLAWISTPSTYQLQHFCERPPDPR